MCILLLDCFHFSEMNLYLLLLLVGYWHEIHSINGEVTQGQAISSWNQKTIAITKKRHEKLLERRKRWENSITIYENDKRRIKITTVRICKLFLLCIKTQNGGGGGIYLFQKEISFFVESIYWNYILIDLFLLMPY